MMIPKTTCSPIAVPAQAIKNRTITAMSDNMYLAFIDLHLAWRLHITNIGPKPQLVFYQFYKNFIAQNFNRGKGPNAIILLRIWPLEVVSKPQITFESKASCELKVERTH